MSIQLSYLACAEDRSWRMLVDYHKLKQVVTPIEAHVPDVVSLFEQVNIILDTWCVSIDLINDFFPPFLSIWSSRSSLLSTSKASNTPSLSYLRRYDDSPSLCHNFVHRELVHLFLPQNITLIHYIDDIMLIGPSDQEVATSLYSLVRHLHVRGWEINPTKIQGPSTSVKFLGVKSRYSF